MKRFLAYVCKQCGGPSPVGVGYAASTDTAPARVTSCPCGYSQQPTP